MTDFATLRQRMVDNQIRTSEVTDHEVIAALLAVPREIFAAPGDRPFAYSDRELKMSAASPNRRMIDPVQIARLVHALPRGPAVATLIVGCGSGYSAAILSRLVGSIVAVEEDRTLAALARDNLASLGIRNVTVAEGLLVEGDPRGGLFDGVLVEGAIEVLPDALVAQLKPGGLLATIERAEGVSRAVLYERVGKTATKRRLFEAWAPLLPGFERRREFVF